jgi:G3E family GTPase
MKNKINLYLLTGFLGSGKTTFLKNIIEDLKDKKIGIIQNEFGKISIDGAIIKADGLEIVEINRGSIFCSCLKIKFADAMMQISDKPIEYLFVESSGLADPSNIGEILEAITEFKGDVYEYKGAICIIDAPNFLEQIDDIETINRQLKHCHLAVINKVDLIQDNTLLQLREKISEINNKVPVVETSFGRMDYDFLNQDLLKDQWVETEDSTNSPENKPKTLSMSFQGMITKQDLTKFLDIISQDTYRIKGFFLLEDGWNQVDVVNRKIDYKKWDAMETESQLVFISKIGPNIIKPIINTWKELIGQEMQLKN